VPWFYPATEADVRGHFLALLEAAGEVPALLYNIPRRTVNDLAPPLLAELADAGFAGMKDSTGDFSRHEAYLDALHGRPFELYVGSEPLVLRSWHRGAAGAVTGLASCRPEPFAALRAAVAAGDEHAAERLQADIARAKAEVEVEGSTVAAVKRRVAAALADRGVTYPPAPRAPFG
jgi:4-hydroxy-tetrahydrodipicolinate synthase